MENHAGAGEFDLPEEIIHHIQSFMNETQAARTAILSKSWYGAWSTRPNLNFEQREFLPRMNVFPKFTKKTLQRYENLNLKVISFRLWMMQGCEDHSLATDLILRAIKLGAADLTLHIPSNRRLFVLPEEVLESETLAKLSLTGSIVDLQRRRSNKEVTCSNLKSLNLCSTTITNGDLFWDLISRCPFVEELTLDNCISLFGEKRRFSSPFCDSAIKLHRLKYLHFNGLDGKDTLYRHELWPKFPCLKELLIWGYNSDYDWKNVRICSGSLELISIYMYSNRITNGRFDVPNIRKFKLVGCELSHFEFETSSKEWESDIQIECHHSNALWFSSLNQLLKVLSSSRVSLSVCSSHLRGDGDGYVGDGLSIPVVESLTVQGCGVTLDFLDTLFWSCRPNFVNIERRLLEKMNVEALRQLHSLPWKALSDDSRNHHQFVRFQLK